MISIIIVGYKSKSDLSDCLTSIYSSSYEKFRILFIDNSDDGSADLIRTSFPKVIVIENTKNLGYAGGNNLLIKKALEVGSDYLLFLNADTILDKHCLENLVKAANKKTILQPLLLLYKDDKETDLINTDGNVLNFLGYSYCGNLGKKVNGKKSCDIPLASGAAMFLPVNVVEKIGSFDEKYFIYHEDADLSLRARIAGYDIKLIAEARIWHKYSFSKHKNKMYYAERNRLRFLLKNFSLRYLILIFPAFLINEILILLYSLVTGWGKEKILGWYEIMRSLPEILEARKTILNNRKTDDREIKEYISSKLEFNEFSNPLFKIYNVFLSLYWSLIKIML